MHKTPPPFRRLQPLSGKTTKGGILSNLGWIEVFVLIQYVSSGILLLPGTQSLRFFIRALPYASSIGLWIWFFSRSSKPAREQAAAREDCPADGPPNGSARINHDSAYPPGAQALALTLVVLGLGLVNPSTPFVSGTAQCVFQLCIVGPCFWIGRAVTRKTNLSRIIWLVFYANALSALVGLLQVYYPGTFMPTEFTTLVSKSYLNSLSYVGANGERIIRPPGLSDTPGMAASSGMITSFLGVVLATEPELRGAARIAALALAGVGLFVQYLTQVRSLFLVMLGALLASAFLFWKRGKTKQVWSIVSLGGGLVVISFIWAVSLGGKVVSERFMGLAQKGLVKSYQQNRGEFLRQTLSETLFNYPLGAGVGRWGMMAVYFPNRDPLAPKSLYAEIQLTGWLYDGGWLLLLLYGSALFVSMRYCYQVSVAEKDEHLARLASVVFAINICIVVESFCAPVFNTQLGIQYWLLYALLYAVVRLRDQGPPEASEPDGPAEPLWKQKRIPTLQRHQGG